MSNKKLGSDFEKEFAKILSDKEFWAMNVPDDKQGQPFDIIAAKNNKIYAFECKTCSTKMFNINRIEVNQRYAMNKFAECGNEATYFVFKFKDKIYIQEASEILSAKENFDITKLCPAVWKL